MHRGKLMTNEQKFLGEFEQLILLSVLQKDNRSYGIEISETLENECQRKVSLGALYTTLTRMEKKGLVVSQLGQASSQRGGKAKKYFSVTAEGKSAVKKSINALRRLTENIDFSIRTENFLYLNTGDLK